MERELARILRQGWATAYNEALIGLNAVAAPVFDASGACIGSVGIVDSIQFLEETASREKTVETMRAGRLLSEALGHRLQEPAPGGGLTRRSSDGRKVHK